MPVETMAPWQLFGMDWIGPLPTTTDGNRYILTLIDYFSRFVIAFALLNARPEDTIRGL